MSEERQLDKSFDQMDESDLAIILSQVGRRILVLRHGVRDTPFWFSVILRLSKWLNNEPKLNDKEKALIIGPNPEGVNGKIRAVKSLRERTGMRLAHAKIVVDKWMEGQRPNSPIEIN